MYDLDVNSDVLPDVVPQLKLGIRFGCAANYEPRITQYIAETFRCFFSAQLNPS